MNESSTIRHLLVPTDFSDEAAAAAEYAAFLATRLDARVTLLHASGHPSRFDDPEFGNVARAGQQEAERLARRRFEELHAAYLQDVRTHSRVVIGARPADAILDVARSSAADLIVMGTHGHGRVATALLGSVAAEVIRESDRPVLTIRQSASEKPRIERILCPVNYSTAAAKAFASALYFASAFDAELLALYFEEGDATDDAIESELERMRDWIGDVPLSVRLTCIAHRGEPGAQVSEFARTHGIDLVVIGAHQTRTASTTTLGSTTEAMTRRAPCPVLTVPTTEALARSTVVMNDAATMGGNA